MPYQKILSVQDISCVGQCSLTVALPILSACGLETAILPSAVLSTHTCGFTGYTFRDLTEDIPAIRTHWEKEGIRFAAIYTGYLGSTLQISYVKDIFRSPVSGGLKIVDPAMADGGKLYPAFDMEFVHEMAGLCAEADIVIPNITEAAFLSGMDYRESYDESYILELCKALCAKGIKTVVLTGVGYCPGKTGVVVYESGDYSYYEHEKKTQGCHGTGDVYASAFVGKLMQGSSLFDAAKAAADFTLRCIELTAGDPDHRYGVKFELALPELMK